MECDCENMKVNINGGIFPIWWLRKKNQITTDLIADKAVTREKIADGAVNEENLSEELKEWLKQGGGGIPDAPKDGKTYARKDNKWVSLRDIKSISEEDGGITTLLKNYFVRMENQEGDFFEVGEEEGAMMSVDEGNVQMVADSGGIHFIVPENAKFELNGKPIGSNEDLEKQVDDLQAAVDEIIAGNITFTAGASPNVIFIGSSTPATITATASKECDIVIKQGSTVLKSDTNVKTLSVTTAGLSNTTSYTAEFTFKGKTTTKTATVTAVGPIYYGSGAVYTDVKNDAHKYGTATTTPARTYAVNVASNGQRVFFLVPATMTINKATLSGFDFPLTMSEQVIDGVRYKVYTSDNTYDAGTINIVIS